MGFTISLYDLSLLFGSYFTLFLAIYGFNKTIEVMKRAMKWRIY